MSDFAFARPSIRCLQPGDFLHTALHEPVKFSAEAGGVYGAAESEFG